MPKQTFIKVFLLLGLAYIGLIAFWPQDAGATNPNLVNFQGKVVAGTGAANPGANVTDGSYTFRFCLYSTATPTTPCTAIANNDAIWRESKSLTVTSGVFQTELGDVTTLPDFSVNSNLYLGVTFNGDAAGEMLPRIHLDSVPYAKYSDNSGQLGGLAASGFIQNQTASLQQANIRIQSAASGSIAEQVTGASGQSVDIFDIFANGVGTALLGVTKDGFVTLQPAASLTSGQTALAQTLTNASSTGGTVNAANQTITVSNTSSASTTNGFNLSMTDNTAGSFQNPNTGIKITLNGSNASQKQIGVDISVNQGDAIRAVTSGTGTIGCINQGSGFSAAICADNTNPSPGGGAGVFARVSAGSGGSAIAGNVVGGNGVIGLNSANGTANNTYTGVRGQSFQSVAAAYNSVAVLGEATGGAGATVYGGYFNLVGSSATAGAALYATNSTVATNILDLQDGNAGSGGTNISVFTVANGGVISARSNAAAGFQIQDSSSSKEILTIDTSGDRVLLGKAGASGLDGKLVFNNATNSNTLTIVTGVTAASGGSGYILNLPTTGSAGTNCLQSTGGSTVGNTTLTFASCGGGGGTLASTYNSAATTGNTILLSSSGGAIKLQDASSTVGSFFEVQNNALTADYFSLTLASSIPHLKVFNASNNAQYADIYWDTTNSVAVFGSSTGTTQIGTTSGPIQLLPGTGNGVTITADAASTYTTTTGSLTLTGAAASTWSTSAGLLTIQGGGGLSLLSSTTSAVSIDSGTTGAVTVGNGSSAKNVTLGNQTGATNLTLQAGSGNINLSPSAGNDVVFSQSGAGQLQLTASAATTADQLAITNASGATSTTAVDGLAVNFNTTGSTASADNSGIRVDVTSNNSGATTTLEGLKIGNLGSAEANSTETGLYVGTGWDVGLDLQSGGLNLASFQTTPPTPAAGNLRVWAKSISGRTMLKVMGSSGVDYPLQPSLFQNNIAFFAPTSGTTVTGGFGTLWAKGGGAGTIATHTPSTTAPAIVNQMHWTQHPNVVTTTNQDMGIKISAADGDQWWRGNASGLGGFFFYSRFVVVAWPANTARLFVGLSSGTTSQAISDTISGTDVVGLWHDTTDGANVLSLVTRNNATTTKTPIAGGTLATSEAMDFYIYAKPNDNTIYYRLDDLNSGVTVVDTSTTTTLPRNTIFMGPQVELSNGTANTTANTTTMGVARIYIESDN